MSNTTQTTPYNPLYHIKTPEQLETYVQERMRAGRRTYGYGAVDKDGELAYWNEDLYASEDKEQIQQEVEAINADHEILGIDDDDEIKHVGFEPPAPYRVVTLYWVDNNAAQAEEGYPQ